MVTIASYLNERADFFTPKKDYLDSARSRRASIDGRLDRDYVVSTFETGSLTHGTGLWLYSDVDYFVRFYGEMPSPATALQRIRSAMVSLYPTTSIRVSSPAVKLSFSTGVSVELVPAYATGVPEMYRIPDPTDSSRWMLSAPQKHLAYVNEAQRRQPETKKVARLLKLWKAKRRVPVSSFYLEMRTAQYMKTRFAAVSVSEGLQEVMSLMSQDRMATIYDPTFVGGSIAPTSTSGYHTEAMSKLSTAKLNLAGAALSAVLGKTEAAIDAWKRVLD